MHELPEPHRSIEVTQNKWVWPDCNPIEINGRKMFCGDVFRATGTTFVRMVEMKHLGESQA